MGKCIAHYWRYHTEEHFETETLEAAVAFLSEGEAFETLSADRIVVCGERVISGAELEDLLWEHEVCTWKYGCAL